MRASVLLVALGLATAVLCGCSPAEPAHDKSYYAAHDPERAAKLTACQDDPGKMAARPNCVNAQAAEADVHTKDFYRVQKPASRVQQPGKL
jgi:hypothetical protein